MAGFNSALAGFKSAFDHSCKLLVTYRHEAELQTVGNVPRGKKTDGSFTKIVDWRI